MHNCLIHVHISLALSAVHNLQEELDVLWLEESYEGKTCYSSLGEMPFSLYLLVSPFTYPLPMTRLLWLLNRRF